MNASCVPQHSRGVFGQAVAVFKFSKLRMILLFYTRTYTIFNPFLNYMCDTSFTIMWEKSKQCENSTCSDGYFPVNQLRQTTPPFCIFEISLAHRLPIYICMRVCKYNTCSYIINNLILSLLCDGTGCFSVLASC